MNKPPIDRESLHTLHEIAGEEFPNIIHRYLADSDRFIKSMNAAFGRADFAEIHEIAHTLKGSSGTLSANQLYELCYQMELVTLKRPNPGFREVAKLLVSIEQEYDQVKSALQQFLTTV